MAETTTETTETTTTETETTEKTQEQQQLELSKETAATTSVTSAEHAKVLARLKASEDKNSLHETERKTQELNNMKSQEKWQEVAQLQEKRGDELETKLQNISSAMVRKEKYNSIHLEAQKLGLKSDAARLIDLMDFEGVQVETTTLGNINVVGAKEAAAALKLESPFMFGNSTANLNTSTPDVTLGGKITVDMVMKAKAKYGKSKDQADFATYENLTKQYQQQ